MTTTRFAPSPTGDLHIGGVRTALYCWLHARQHQGTFRLRIEDTDQTRSTQSSTQVILDGLSWLGLEHDGEVVYQSQRFAHYDGIIEQMLADGLAYYCWCTPEELDAMREAQKARGEKPRYNGKYRNGGEPVPGVDPVVRFKNPQEGSVVFDDKVRGRISISNSEMDDFIIRRSDGSPTYNFCVVVDDAEQEISLVIRGDDHINNTPRQINLYHALGYRVPEFAHVPMILGDDGKRLSKRHGATNVLDYRNEGYLPEAVLNYLLRLGWSHGDQEIFSREEMLQYFDIANVHSAAAAFNTEKLRWLNQHYLKSHTAENLIQPLQAHLKAADIALDEATILAAIPHYQERAKTLKEMAENMRWLGQAPSEYPEKAAQKAFKGEATANLLNDLAERLQALANYDEASIHGAIEACVTDNEVGFGKVGQPARLAVTGGAPSPDLAVTLCLPGRDSVVKRLQQAVDYINENKG
ncbi:glutamate--tRNA ligase [Suttonella sp. R2A3]|uniref:glutamate--tRNA ligase n=1 Tax=Suttonella sp. R2A3 TaxID=2908648 RepID=UPI001F3D758C|nr:glutamate--tRNA ligase [Suttonella sp. R2A3]UJF24452.1 glutamate--tRNA ligase [Suttonella sp. R2A3]